MEQWLTVLAVDRFFYFFIGNYSPKSCHKSCRNDFCMFWAENYVPEGWEGFRQLPEGDTLHSDRT